MHLYQLAICHRQEEASVKEILMVGRTTKFPRLQLHQRRIIIIDHHGYQPKIISHGVHRLLYTGIVITFRQDMKRLVGLGKELMVSYESIDRCGCVVAITCIQLC